MRIEWVIAVTPPRARTPERSELSLMPVAQNMMFLPRARSSAKCTFQQLLFEAVLDELLALGFVARGHLRLDVATEAFDGGGPATTDSG